MEFSCNTYSARKIKFFEDCIANNVLYVLYYIRTKKVQNTSTSHTQPNIICSSHIINSLTPFVIIIYKTRTVLNRPSFIKDISRKSEKSYQKVLT